MYCSFADSCQNANNETPAAAAGDVTSLSNRGTEYRGRRVV